MASVVRGKASQQQSRGPKFKSQHAQVNFINTFHYYKIKNKNNACTMKILYNLLCKSPDGRIINKYFHLKEKLYDYIFKLNNKSEQFLNYIHYFLF